MVKEIKEYIKAENKSFNSIVKRAKGYGYDSLCLRYKMARDAQMQLEIIEDKRITGGMKQNAIRARADRDEMRFYEILNDMIGEHD